ncbi:MAG: Ca-activated chloride channel [Actinomycetota bacterium]|nr:Ca-activated chloride channel [Actinomycetota bacterium]
MMAVTFLSPGRLWLFVVVAALAGAYLMLAQRRRHYAVRFTNLALLESVAPRRPGWRRHVPAAACGLALLFLVVGLARPARAERVPKEAATVMLVIDVSASMEATDVAPTRLAAAVSAASKFVNGLPARLQVGLVAFDRTPRVLASPTSDHALVTSALKQLQTGPGTASGDAVSAALDAIAATQGDVASTGKQTAAIVLLSDGVTTIGTPVEDAAAAAAQQHIPVTTIAFGTDSGTVNVQGRLIPVPADDATMKAVADTTGGKAFTAASAGQLNQVYKDIGSRVGYTVQRHEIGMTFVGIAMGLLVVAMGAALVWSGRML